MFKICIQLPSDLLKLLVNLTHVTPTGSLPVTKFFPLVPKYQRNPG